MKTLSTKIFLFLGFYLLLFPFSPDQALAQRGTPVKIQQLLNRLDQNLQILEALERQYPNKELRQSIETIRDYRQKALQEAGAGHLRAAQQKLNVAIKLADSALKRSMTTIRNSLQGELDDQIQQAEALLHQHYDPDADRLLKTAKGLREKANKAFQKGDYSKASSYLKTERKVLENCLKLLQKFSSENLAAFQTVQQNFQELKNKAATLLLHTRTSLGASLYNQAVAQAKKADLNFKRGQMEQAIRFYQWATRLMLRAIDLLQGQNVAASEQAREALTLTQQILQSTKQHMLAERKNTNRIEKRLLMEAEKLLQKAERNFDSQNYVLAMQQADVARKLLAQLNRGIGPQKTNYREMLQGTISDLEESMKELRNQKDRASSTQTLYNLSMRFLNRAKQNLSQGNLQACAANLLVANRLTSQFEKILKNPHTSPATSVSDLEKDFQNLQNQVSQLDPEKLNAMQKSYYDLLKYLLKQIAPLIRKQNVTEASQLLTIAHMFWQKSRP